MDVLMDAFHEQLEQLCRFEKELGWNFWKLQDKRSSSTKARINQIHQENKWAKVAQKDPNTLIVVDILFAKFFE